MKLRNKYTGHVFDAYLDDFPATNNFGYAHSVLVLHMDLHGGWAQVVVGPKNAAELYMLVWATPEERVALQETSYFARDVAGEA
jgi:hypothetical protein